MDQDAFRETYREINERPCPFEKAVLTNQCECRHAERFCIAEREGLSCLSDAGQQRCLQWLERVREQARFALKTAAHPDQPALGHGKAIAIQVGGLRGLHVTLHPDEGPPVIISDVDALLREALARHGDFGQVDMQAVIQQVAAYKSKKRARRNRR